MQNASAICAMIVGHMINILKAQTTVESPVAMTRDHVVS